MMKDIHWQSLSRFESHDFVTRWYKKAHGRNPNTAKVSQINACFAQGREYFSNAGSSAMSVNPQYSDRFPFSFVSVTLAGLGGLFVYSLISAVSLCSIVPACTGSGLA